MTYLSHVPNVYGSDREHIHQALWRGFPMSHGGKFPCQYVSEPDSVIVRSETEPYWCDPSITVEREKHAWAQGDKASLVVDMLPHRQHKGKTVRPSPDQAMECIHRLIHEAGLTIEDDTLHVNRFHAWSSRPISLDMSARITARVRVHDAQHIQRALVNGIGRWQFLGFGMLVLSPRA